MILNNRLKIGSNFSKVNIFTVVIIIFVFSLFSTSRAEAASLYLRASNSKVTVGSLVTINLFVDTQGKTINNAEAAIQFSNDLVDVVSVSSRSSIFSLWVEAPSYSNGSGRVSFNGGVPDPGYNGGGGNVLSIIVKAKKAGTASFIFSGAAVRENDGLGTDILSGQSSASIVISSNTAEPTKPTDPIVVQPPVEETPTPATGAPVSVSSNTFPDQNAYYTATDGLVSWRLPAKVTAVQTLLDNSPNTTPTIKYTPPISQKSLAGLSDGVWYFHVRYLLDNVWSKTTTYKFQIDTTAPTNLSVVPEKTNNCIVGIRVKADDALSGIDYYNVTIDNEATVKVPASDSDNLIPWPALKAGHHQVLAVAYDKAGNKAESITPIDVDELLPPVLDSVPGKVKIGEKLEISGHSEYPNSNLKLVITFDSGDEKTYDVITDKTGKFTFTSKPMQKEGSYQISAYFVGCGGMNNSTSTKSSVGVENVEIVKTIPEPKDTSNRLYIIGLIVELILILILLLGWYKYIKLRGRMEAIKRRNDNLTLTLLLEKANKDISILTKAQKKKKLNHGEEKAIDSLKEIIDDIEMMKREK